MELVTIDLRIHNCVAVNNITGLILVKELYSKTCEQKQSKGIKDGLMHNWSLSHDSDRLLFNIFSIISFIMKPPHQCNNVLGGGFKDGPNIDVLLYVPNH